MIRFPLLVAVLAAVFAGCGGDDGGSSGSGSGGAPPPPPPPPPPGGGGPPPPPATADWIVDASAAPGGDGSASRPFRTINEAKAVLRPGQTVGLRSGTYNERVDFVNTTQGATVRTYLRAEPGHAPVIDGAGLSTSGFLVQLNRSPNVSFWGITFRNSAGTGLMAYYSDGCEVVNCTFDRTVRGITFYYASAGHVYGSDVYGGVSGKGSVGTIVQRSRVHHSAAEGITLHAGSRGCLYLDNEVYDNTAVNVYLDNCSDMTVEGNLVYMTAASGVIGIMMADENYGLGPLLSDLRILNNVVVNHPYGIRFWEGEYPGQSGMRGVSIVNNTVVDSSGAGLSFDAGPHSGSVVRNNVVSGTGFHLVKKGTSTGVTVDHNLWDRATQGSPFSWAGTSYTHGAWRAATGQGSGDLLADPLFAGPRTPPATNFRLRAGSPAVDAGVTGAVVPLLDFEDRARDAAPDLGAFEAP